MLDLIRSSHAMYAAQPHLVAREGVVSPAVAVEERPVCVLAGILACTAAPATAAAAVDTTTMHPRQRTRSPTRNKHVKCEKRNSWRRQMHRRHEESNKHAGSAEIATTRCTLFCACSVDKHNR